MRLHYVMPHVYGEPMATKLDGVLNWQHFSNLEAPVANSMKGCQSISIIQSLTLILRESVTLFETKNLTSRANMNPGTQMISVIAKAISYSTSELQTSIRYSGLKYLSRENLLNRHNNIMHDSDIKSASNSKTSVLYDNFDSCQSCQIREKVKLKSLETIKNHILSRLQLPRLPNITKPIAVPHSIIDKFYKNFNGMLAGSRRSAAFYDMGSGSEIKTNDAGKLSLVHANAPRQTAKDLQFLPRYSKHAGNVMLHARHIQYGQQQYYQQLFNQPKYQTFRNPHKQPSHGARGKKHTMLELADVEYEQQADIQNDERQKFSNYQQIFSRIKQKELAVHEKGELFNAEDSGFISPPAMDDSYGRNNEHLTDSDDESYSHVDSIYIFPTTTHVRHNRRWEIINFKLDHSHLTIVRTIIHLYIRGHDWMRDHYPESVEHSAANENARTRRDLIIVIHHVVRRPNNQNLTHTMKLAESRHRIPSGSGQWVQFEIKHAPANWLSQNTATMTLAVKTQESWMRSFLVINTEDSLNKQFPPHIEAFVKQSRRKKRSTSLDCQESDHEVRCCRYPLKVNFTNFGWNFVVAPTSFDAYFCNGECKVGYLEQYTHTHIASLTTSATPCCSPTKMSPLSLLYFDQDHNLILSTIPNMSVEKCSCS